MSETNERSPFTQMMAVQVLDSLTDRLAAVARLLEHPETAMSRPEIMDCVAMSVSLLAQRYADVSYRLRQITPTSD